MNREKVATVFTDMFADTGLEKGVFCAPGRVNLIGEHTDYNDGFVLPMAINREIVLAAQLRDDERVCAYSLDFDERSEFTLDNLEKDPDLGWVNYIRGVLVELRRAGFSPAGMNLVFSGDIPLGAGLSSSAALEVVTAVACRELNGLDLGGVDLALLCQRAENNFVGVSCGIMDQYISALGEKDAALLIDCRDRSYEPVPFAVDDYRVVICDSGVQRELVDSAYNQRRQQCEQAVDFFNDRLERKIIALRDVGCEELEQLEAEMPDIMSRRARHVITENERVLAACRVLKEDNFHEFGRLMYESHFSLRDDYEVSCSELDLLVELARTAGVEGARMTGAGFGGCTVNLVKSEDVEDFSRKIRAAYEKETGIEPDIYVSGPEAGAGPVAEAYL
ncbi:MAG: galactokinase [Halanaerobiaceae bacterium]